MKNEFVHLHVHSEYSLLDGASRIDDLISEAKKNGMRALALTDHGSMYGAIAFYRACKREGIQPIIGVEVYVTNHDLQAKIKKGEQHLFHLLLLAKNEVGYRNLIQLTTKAHLQGFYFKPRVTKQWLLEHQEGLICLSSCLAGELAQALLQQQGEKARQIAMEHLELFGQDNYYLELQDHGLPEQKKVNQQLIRLSEELSIPLVVTNDVHYTYAQDATAHDCLLCIGTGKKVQDEQRLRFPSAQFYFKNAMEMKKLFPHLEQAYSNTAKIAQKCQLDIPLGQEILPAYPVPDDGGSMGYLRARCEDGLQTRYNTITANIQARLDHELEVIGKMGYADYFLIVWDFMKFAHDQGIMTGPGRGSAAGSLVAYALRITNIDPIKYRLLFERFLNPERVSMPDIDIDFSDRRRDEVIEYVSHKYGKDRVAQIITFGTLGAKASLRDVGRAMSVPLKVIDQIAKNVPSGPGVTLEMALGQSEALQAMVQADVQVEAVFATARQLEGLARHTSTHAAGVVISAQSLTEYVPLQEGQDGVALTQYPMEDLEQIGLLKMDFLGLRNLSLIEETLSIINRSISGSEPFDLEQIPLDDADTFALLSVADTSGVFQLESEGMRNVLKRLKPSSFEDVIAVLALYRPGPMENIPLFIEAKHGLREISYPHTDLTSILQPTYGIIVYQEQIMQIASTMAGFSLGEADLLRRAVSKKKREVLEQERGHFEQGCLKQGYDQQTAVQVYDLIVRFANYGFNRSHSAAYALIAYQLAYLKCHYPGAFLASLISMHMGSEEKLTDYLSQARKRGIDILPPSVLHSATDVTMEQNSMRLGLGLIKHVGKSVIDEIIKHRDKTPYRNVLDFCQKVNLRVCNRKVLESLILSGAMDELGMHRAQALANLDHIVDMSEQAQGLRESDQLFFFADELPDDYEWLDVPVYQPVEKLRYEKEMLGLYLSGHPLDSYRSIAISYCAVRISEVVVSSEQAVRTYGYVQQVKRIQTKKGEAMAFVQLEDEGSQLECIIFPNVLQEKPLLYEEGKLLFIEGKLQKRDPQTQLVAAKVTDLMSLTEEKMANKHVQLFIKIASDLDQQIMQNMKKILLQHPGPSPIYLHYEAKRKTVRLSTKFDALVTTDMIHQLQNLLEDPDAVKTKYIT